MITNPSEDYARGWIPFLGAKIFLDSRPLIPRVETEYWVEKAIERTAMLYHSTQPVSILDLFAGSGCIGIAVLKHVPGTTVDFGDIEPRHFPTITKSLAANSIDPARARIIETDVYSNIDKRYDLILANPPYLAHGANLDPSLAFEPSEALFAGDGGFALIDATVRGMREHLNLRGQLWLEHDPAQAPQIPGIHYRDQFGQLRYTVANA